MAQKKRQRAKPGMQDFEEIFGKDIDQFLEDSEWDVAEKKKNWNCQKEVNAFASLTTGDQNNKW